MSTTCSHGDTSANTPAVIIRTNICGCRSFGALVTLPTFSSRVGCRPNEMWNLGLSASAGPYLLSEAAPTLPRGRGISDYRELLLGQDVSFAWHHWQVWAEFYETRFEVPRIGNADTFAYYFET